MSDRQETAVAGTDTVGGRAFGRRRRLAVAFGVVVALLAIIAYTGYVGAKASEEFIHPNGGWKGCDTPGVRYGWSYEAINYDAADDATLIADRIADQDPLMLDCRPADHRGEAGDEVTTSDGIHLDGWYIPASAGVGPNGPTIVVVPGYTSNKSEILLYAPAFHRDYNLVLMDLRDQGRSSRAEVTLGFNERKDVAAMLDWLVEAKHPAWIGAMGNSMGAATVLAEATTDERVQALILDSMHARLELSVGKVLETEHGLPSIPAAWATMTGVHLRTGLDLAEVDPERTITKLGKRPVLLLHSTTDKIDPRAEAAEVNFKAALDAGVPVELHYCDGAATSSNGWHGRVIKLCRAEWTRWANHFLAVARRD